MRVRSAVLSKVCVTRSAARFALIRATPCDTMLLV